MNEVLKLIQNRINDIGEKISKEHVEELNFLKELLGKFLVSEDVDYEPLNVGDALSRLSIYAKEIPIYVYNTVPGTDNLCGFSALEGISFNKEKNTVELYYNMSDNNSYEDY